MNNLQRLEAMRDDDGGTWDLSDKDREALTWAVKVIYLAMYRLSDDDKATK